MTEERFQEMLQALIDEISYLDETDRQEYSLEDYADLQDADTRSFEQSGLLTNNKGIVVSLSDGSEFQLTIIRSK